MMYTTLDIDYRLPRQNGDGKARLIIRRRRNIRRLDAI